MGGYLLDPFPVPSKPLVLIGSGKQGEFSRKPRWHLKKRRFGNGESGIGESAAREEETAERGGRPCDVSAGPATKAEQQPTVKQRVIRISVIDRPRTKVLTE